MPDESSQVDELSQPSPPPQPAAQMDTERKHRKLETEEFEAKLEMTKAFCDTAKGYVQISSAGLALPLLFRKRCWERREGRTASWDRAPGN